MKYEYIHDKFQLGANQFGDREFRNNWHRSFGYAWYNEIRRPDMYALYTENNYLLRVYTSEANVKPVIKYLDKNRDSILGYFLVKSS